MTQGPATPEQTHRFLLLMWIAMLPTLGVYYFLTTVVKPAQADPNSPLVFPLLGIAILMVPASLYCKARFGTLQDRPRPLAMVRAGYVIALVFSEIPAFLGIVVFLLSGWPKSWVFFVISAAGFVLNFPRRDDFERAK